MIDGLEIDQSDHAAPVMLMILGSDLSLEHFIICLLSILHPQIDTISTNGGIWIRIDVAKQ
jgi:hypothetical protein